MPAVNIYKVSVTGDNHSYVQWTECEGYIGPKQLIDSKRQLLERKQKKLKEIQKQNQFLGVVRDDYLKYQNYITQQKHDQINALKIINNYIDDLTYHCIQTFDMA